MARDLTSTVQSAFSAAEVHPIILVRIAFPSGALRVHSGIGNVTFNAETYTGLGALGAIATITETIDGSANTCTLSLSSDTALIALMLTEVGGARGSAAKVWLGSKHITTGALLSDPAERFSGTVSNFSQKDEGVAPNMRSTITAHLVDETGNQERLRTRYYNGNDQKRIDPTDTSMRYVADLPNKQLNWGNAKVYTTSPGGGDNSDGGDQTSDLL